MTNIDVQGVPPSFRIFTWDAASCCCSLFEDGSRASPFLRQEYCAAARLRRSCLARARTVSIAVDGAME